MALAACLALAASPALADELADGIAAMPGGVEDVRIGGTWQAGGKSGVYRAGLQVDRPGLYRAWIERNGNRVAAAEFEVLLPSRENADPSPDPEAMRLLASKTGGRAVDLANWAELADEFPGGDERREPISSRLDDAWDQ